MAKVPKFFDVYTNRMYVGLRNGRCVAIALEYKNDAKENGKVRASWAREGLDVITVMESEMKPYYDDMKALIREREKERLL